MMTPQTIVLLRAGIIKEAGDWDDQVDILEAMGKDPAQVGRTTDKMNRLKRLEHLYRFRLWERPIFPERPTFSADGPPGASRAFNDALRQYGEMTEMQNDIRRTLRGGQKKYYDFRRHVRKNYPYEEQKRRVPPARNPIGADRALVDSLEDEYRQSLYAGVKTQTGHGPKPLIPSQRSHRREVVGHKDMQREMLEHVLQKQDSRDLRGALQQQNVSKALSEASRSGDPSNLAELPLAEKLLAQKWVRDLEFDDRPKMLKSLSKALF